MHLLFQRWEGIQSLVNEKRFIYSTLASTAVKPFILQESSRSTL